MNDCHHLNVGPLQFTICGICKYCKQTIYYEAVIDTKGHVDFERKERRGEHEKEFSETGWCAHRALGKQRDKYREILPGMFLEKPKVKKSLKSPPKNKSK